MNHHAHTEGTTGTSARKDPPAGHGMLVLGLDAIFFYHLPMFMSPHDYQVVLEGTLSQQGSDPQRTYREDRKGHVKTRVYTFAPVPFVLPDLFPPAPKLTKIRGDLFRGHFEQPSEYPEKPSQIGSGVDVNVTDVVFVQKLLPLPTPLDGLEYLLFGKSKELFLAHVITRKGDFDQVVSAEITGHPVPRRRVAAGRSGSIQRKSQRIFTAARRGQNCFRKRSSLGQRVHHRGHTARGVLHVGT